MIRAILDTNIIISAALTKHSMPDQVLRYAVKHCILLISEETFKELQEKLLSSKFDKYVPLGSRKDILESLRELSEIITIKQQVIACRDSKDNKFLELAINGKADCVVTGDKDLLVLNPFEGIDILTAVKFLEKRTIP